MVRLDSLTYTCPRCHATSQSPADERARYCARCHQFEDMPVVVVPTPRCPRCDEPPGITISVQQAFCGNDDCNVFCWNMLDDRETFEAKAVQYSLCLVEPESQEPQEPPC